MKKFNQLTALNSTIIDWAGKEYRTTQDPWVNDYNEFGNLEYKAHALDSEENEFIIHWNEREGFEYESNDLSEACDWDNPIKVIKF